MKIDGEWFYVLLIWISFFFASVALAGVLAIDRRVGILEAIIRILSPSSPRKSPRRRSFTLPKGITRRKEPPK